MTFIEKVVSVQRDLTGLNPYSIGIWSATTYTEFFKVMGN